MTMKTKEYAKRVGTPRRNARKIAKGFNAGTDGDAKDQAAMRKIISRRG